MQAYLSIQEVTKRYANHLALDDVSIEIPQNKIFGLLGPNGAGKTSLIRIINQITAPDSGKVLIKGQALQADHITRIGYLPEERGLYKKMKVGEQAIYLAQLKGLSKHEAKTKLKDWFERFDILNWWDRKVEELSKGMQQKIQFVVTVLHKPELLIFDEPFSGFDPINVNLLKAEILKLREQGATIIFSTHNMASVEELCDQIALINQGKKILEGEVNALKIANRNYTYNCEIHYPVNGWNTILESLPVELLNVKSELSKIKLHIKTASSLSSNELLKMMLPLGEVASFQELLPSMNDIFIQKVGKPAKPAGDE
ncbi:MAG: ATP-binding cassette domain-containing protein [Bacteroidales bacterium]|jgi:ABC-2 type transport system ATP-binding protein|nr:ATP-binding cassette domain-containing protein [Bacteroidales bacterium]MDN5348836.1 type transport system ATP-binding protein [Bacteroidales bacterium]